MTDSKLVEILKKRSDECRRLSDIAEGTALATYRAANADFYDEIIAALEAAEAALEPFAIHADQHDGYGLMDDFQVPVRLGRLRSARSAYALIRGEKTHG